MMLVLMTPGFIPKLFSSGSREAVSLTNASLKTTVLLWAVVQR